MKFMIGTNNSEKITSAEHVLTELLHDREFTIDGEDVPSGFGETPIGEETKLGAYNRAKALAANKQCDYAIGIESGIVERYGDIYEEAWCCVMTADVTVYGYSSGLKVPKVIVHKMESEGIEHYQALRSEEIKNLLIEKTRKDTWGNYSAMMVVRKISFEESMRNALVQMFAPSDSLYTK